LPLPAEPTVVAADAVAARGGGAAAAAAAGAGEAPLAPGPACLGTEIAERFREPWGALGQAPALPGEGVAGGWGLGVGPGAAVPNAVAAPAAPWGLEEEEEEEDPGGGGAWAGLPPVWNSEEALKVYLTLALACGHTHTHRTALMERVLVRPRRTHIHTQTVGAAPCMTEVSQSRTDCVQ
jgi:hypothetical protein